MIPGHRSADGLHAGEARERHSGVDATLSCRQLALLSITLAFRSVALVGIFPSADAESRVSEGLGRLATLSSPQVLWGGGQQQSRTSGGVGGETR